MVKNIIIDFLNTNNKNRVVSEGEIKYVQQELDLTGIKVFLIPKKLGDLVLKLKDRRGTEIAEKSEPLSEDYLAVFLPNSILDLANIREVTIKTGNKFNPSDIFLPIIASSMERDRKDREDRKELEDRLEESEHTLENFYMMKEDLNKTVVIYKDTVLDGTVVLDIYEEEDLKNITLYVQKNNKITAIQGERFGDQVFFHVEPESDLLAMKVTGKSWRISKLYYPKYPQYRERILNSLKSKIINTYFVAIGEGELIYRYDEPLRFCRVRWHIVNIKYVNPIKICLVFDNECVEGILHDKFIEFSICKLDIKELRFKFDMGETMAVFNGFSFV